MERKVAEYTIKLMQAYLDDRLSKEVVFLDVAFLAGRIKSKILFGESVEEDIDHYIKGCEILRGQ